MNKWYAFLCTSMLLSVIYLCNAQERTSIRQSPNGTVTDKGPTTNKDFTESYTRETRDNLNNLTEKTTWTKDHKGNWTFTTEKFTPGGTLISRKEGNLELKNGKLAIKQYKLTGFRDGKLITSEKLGAYGPDGVFREIETMQGPTKTPDHIYPESSMQEMDKEFRPPFQDNPTEPPPPVKTTLNSGDERVIYNCGQRIVLSFGPSYLKRDFGPEKESCMGFHAIANYQIGRNFGAGVDFSSFKKNIMDEILITTLVLANAEYRLWNQKKDCQPFSVFTRIAIGIMKEKYGDISESENGTVFGGGLALKYKLSRKFKLGLTGDYLYTSVNDQKINMLRASLLLTYGFIDFK